MRNTIFILMTALVVVLSVSSGAFAQGEGGGARVEQLVPSIPPPDGWGNCP